MQRDAIQIIIDCSKAMFEKHSVFDEKKYIDIAIDSVRMLMQQNMLYGASQNVVGVMLYGYDQKYKQCTYREIDKLNLQVVRKFLDDMKKLPEADQQIGNPWDILEVGINNLQDWIGKKKYNKRVFL